MQTNTSSSYRSLAFALTLAFLAACSGSPSPAPVVLPDKVLPDTKNPLTDAAAAVAGKKHYQANCTLCHGDEGKGDGAAADAFDTKPTPLNTGDVVKDPDGELFLAVKNGKGKMPAAKKMTDEQIWQVIAYVRTLAGK